MKKMLALVMALAMTFSMAAFGQAEEITPPKKPLRYSLGTSSSGGNFYLVGGGIATVLNNALPDFFVMTRRKPAAPPRTSPSFRTARRRSASA